MPEKGQNQRRFFVNAAGVGFDASVVAITERLPKYLGGTIPYVTGLLRCLFSYRKKPIDLCLEDRVEARCVLTVVVANGCYLGGGMYVALRARVDAGLLDVVTIGDIGKLELLRVFPTVYNGTHISHPKVRMETAKRITIESSEQLLVHTDDELLGETPVSFWLVPAALSILI